MSGADAWIIYIVVFFSGLVIAFHAVGTAALVTGSSFVHITAVTGVITILWGVARWIMGPLQQERKILSYAVALRQARDAIRALDPRVRWSVLVAGGVASLFLLDAATRPPDGFDGLVYHLPLAVRWLKEQSLAFIQESWKFQMPSNGELVSLFFMYLDNELILFFASVPITLLAVLAVYALARRLSTPRDPALLAALGFGTMPIVLYNTFDHSVDLFAAAFFLGSICLLLAIFQQSPRAGEKRWPLVAMAGLAFGLGLGARYIYVPLLLFMTGLCALVSMRGVALRWEGIRQASLSALTFVISSLLPSLFWYARNFLAAGNPLHPLRFSLGAHGIDVSIAALSERPRIISPGAHDTYFCLDAGNHDIRHWLVSPWQDCWMPGWDHYSSDWGLGAVFATFVPVMAMVGVLLAIATLVRRRRVEPLHILLLVATVFLAYWWLGLIAMARSILPVMGLLFVVVAVGIGVLSSSVQRILYLLFLVAMISNGVLLAAKPFQFLASRLQHQIWSRSSYYDIAPVIEDLPAGSVILNASSELRNYPLLGRRWQNRVITDRALMEPTTVNVIDERFIEEWGIEYVYYRTGQEPKLGDEVKREALYEHMREASGPDEKEILYRILR